MSDFKIIVFANGYVGENVIRFVLKEYPEDLFHTVLIDENYSIYNTIIEKGVGEDCITWAKDVYSESFLKLFEENVITYGILAWWPRIIKEPLLSKPESGFINFHPSYLPYNRGKDPNFWSIVEETPFGVSLQLIDETIDGGDIILQEKIEKSWTDTGESIYKKSLNEIITLFKDNYYKIRRGQVKRKKQNPDEETFHYRKELNPASQIFLENKYKARDLLNLLRARTFPPHPACYFFDDGNKYEVRIDIQEISNKQD